MAFPYRCPSRACQTAFYEFESRNDYESSNKREIRTRGVFVIKIRGINTDSNNTFKAIY